MPKAELTVVVEPKCKALADRLGYELVDVCLDKESAGKYLRISHPAKAFIALRTVRRDIDKIALLAPDDVAEQLIQHRIGGADMAGALHVGMHGDAGEVVR